MASAILIATSERLARQVQTELSLQLPTLDGESIARESLAANGVIAVVETTEQAIELVNMTRRSTFVCSCANPGTPFPW